MSIRLIRCWLLLAAVLLSSCTSDDGGGGGTANTGGRAKWTYMVYMAGDNTLSDAVIADLQEIASVGSTSAAKVVVQAEVRPSTEPGTSRGLIVRNMPDANWTKVGAGSGGVDMGKAATLTEFIQWAAAAHPADNYALVLWSHGAGWKTQPLKPGLVRGALQDESSGSFMSLDDIAKGVRDSGVHFGLINFDACLMAMYEVAHSFKGLTDYLVASEEVEPGDGDDYVAITNALTANPNMSARDLALSITQSYKAFYASAGRTSVTKSAIDLTKIDSVKTTVEALAGELTTNIGTHRTAVQSAQVASTNYEYPYNRDLADFARKLRDNTSDTALRNAATAVENAVTAAVVSNQVYATDNSMPIARSKGLAIYLPTKEEIGQGDLSQYEGLAVSKNGGTRSAWSGFVNLLVTGNVSNEYLPQAPGNFAFFITWDNPAVDIDLYVYEPLNLVAPFMGTTSANGFLSGDSAETGVQLEYYAAAQTVEAGDYDVFINYYDCTASASGCVTNVTLWYDDGSGRDAYVVDTQRMKVPGKSDAPFGAYPDNDVETYIAMLENQFADWYYGITHRAETTAGARAAVATKAPAALPGKTLGQRVHNRIQLKNGRALAKSREAP